MSERTLSIFYNRPIVLYINIELTICTTFMFLEADNTRKGIVRDGDSLNRQSDINLFILDEVYKNMQCFMNRR